MRNRIAARQAYFCQAAFWRSARRHGLLWADAFPSHQAYGFIADLRLVEGRLPERKPHDDFRGPFPIGRAPQIKIGNDIVERL